MYTSSSSMNALHGSDLIVLRPDYHSLRNDQVLVTLYSEVRPYDEIYQGFHQRYEDIAQGKGHRLSENQFSSNSDFIALLDDD